MENQETAFQKTVSFVKAYKYFFMLWIFAMSFMYWDHIVHYPNCILEKHSISGLYDFFDYVDDPIREQEALEYARSNGNGWRAEMYIQMGLRFLKPKPSIWKFILLLIMPFLWLLIVFQLQISFNRLRKRDEE